jgi:GT2 family glycosyltransferase
MTAPLTVGIPTYARGVRVLDALEQIKRCAPAPAEIIVHVDASDGSLEQAILSRHPEVKLISNPKRVGPGGGRHRCLHQASQPYFASFDDDSWPLDADYFAQAVALFDSQPKCAALEASIFHQGQQQLPQTDTCSPISSYTGCGHLMRVDAYREIIGYVDRIIPYGLEETDVSLQLQAKGWHLIETRQLRVLHDTRLGHHQRPEITAGTIQNALLLAWLRYPKRLWPYALLQFGNVVAFMLRQGRFRGIIAGILGCPAVLREFKDQRHPLPPGEVVNYLLHRTPPRQPLSQADEDAS